MDKKQEILNDLKKQEITEALRGIVDPELGLNVVQLGLIREIKLGENVTEIDMILTSPFCPYGPHLINQVKEISGKIVEGPVNVNLLTEPWDPSMLEDPDLLETW